MLGETGLSTKTVFVRLLDEGTDVYRRTEATVLAGGRVRLLATCDYDPTDEQWEFKPGSIVVCEMHEISGRNEWLAARLA